MIACGNGQSKPSGPQLVLYSTHGREQIEPVVERFRVAHPEITVEWRQYSTVDLFNAVRVNKDSPQADVWWGGPHTTFMQAESDGLLATYRPTWADQVGDAARSPNDKWYGNYRMPECIMYNANVLAPDEAPQEWDDLITPEWKDRIVIREPSKSGTMKAIFGAMVWRFYKDTQSADEGMAWLAKLHENVAVYAPDPRAMYQMLNTKETPVTVWNMVDAHIQTEKNGFNFKAILPESGVPVLVEGIAIIEGAPNRKEAEIFYEWVTSREELLHQAEQFARIPARLDIEQSALPQWMQEQTINAMEIDPAIYQPLEQPWMDRFREEIQTK
jgi:iron(III) transport system substrate-binding protein